MGKCEFRTTPDLNLARNRTQKFGYKYDEIKYPETLFPYAKGKSFFIHTYGCQANYRDEEVLAGMLAHLGFEKTSDVSKANVIILNTCAVRENAEQKVFGMVGELKKYKTTDNSRVICICGCMVQQQTSVEKLMKTYHHVDLIFGTHNLTNFPTLLNEVITKRIRLVDVPSSPSDIQENLPSKRLSSFKAFVNISYGCDKFCTYCIVPYTRGKERSRLMKDILAEVQELKDLNYQEVTLLGQNVNAYGKDLNDGTTFAKLLEEVAKIGIPRVRFLTSHPWDFGEDIVDVIAKYDNIMKYIHLPVQSGSSEILRLMGRRYDADKYLAIVKMIRNKIPDIALSTDIIVGFPNETYEQFKETVSLCEKVQYDSAFTFIYSPRKGTPAAKIEDNVSPKEKSTRFRELVKALEVGFEKKGNEMVGKTYAVLVEGPSEKNPELLSGYTEKNKLIHFKGDLSLVGKIVNVKITESHTYSFIGEIVHG